MKLYISEATLRTIEKFGSASLTHISATPSDHMSIELDAAPLATEASKPAPSVEQDERGAFEEFNAALTRLSTNTSVSMKDRVMILSNATFLLDEYARASSAVSAEPSVEQDERGARVAAFKGWFKTAGIWNNAITERAWLAACDWMQARAASTSANVAQGDNAALIHAFDSALSGVPRYVIDRFGVEHVADKGGWIKESDLFDRFAASTSANVAQGSIKPQASLVTFDEFVQYGKDHGANIVNGMPWSFSFNGHAVTHETDDLYFIGTPSIKFRRGEMLLATAFGEHRLLQVLSAPTANVAQGAVAVATVKVYETYTGQNGWTEVTQEEYDRTKDKYEHRIRRVSAPPAQTADVAQGAEAVVLTEDQRQILEWCKNYHFRRCTEGDFHLRIVAVVNQILDAPPSPSALTDDARECLADVVSHYRALYAGLAFQLNEAAVIENSDDMTYWKHEIKALERMYAQAERALTAAQSASGDTK